MTRLFATTATALLFATGAMAQSDGSNSSSSGSGGSSSGQSESSSGQSGSGGGQMSSQQGGGSSGDTPFAQVQPDPTSDIFASDMIGSQIYGTDQQIPEMAGEGAEENWDQLGEISDLMLTPDGQIEYAILGIGGFLGIGERNVAVDMSQLNVVRSEQDQQNYFLLIQATQQEIEGAPEFQRPENSGGSGGGGSSSGGSSSGDSGGGSSSGGSSSGGSSN